MSLVLVRFNEKFVAACCDGKAIHKHADGTITPAAENVSKIHSLTERIGLAAVGDADLGPYLAKEATSVVRHLSGIPEEAFTFKALQAAIPMWVCIFCESRDYAVPQEHAVILFGYDESQQRLRGVGWGSKSGFAPVEIPAGTLVIMGHNEGEAIADSLTNSMGAASSAEATTSELERIVREVGRRAPELVNENTRSLIITSPSVPSPAPTFADANGNLMLKNVAAPAAATNNPSTTSATYAVIPEMTQTITTKGNKVLLIFTAQAGLASAGSGDFAFFKDGVKISQDYSIPVSTLSLVPLTFIDTPTAASHTFDVRFKVSIGGNTLTVAGIARTFQVVELG